VAERVEIEAAEAITAQEVEASSAPVLTPESAAVEQSAPADEIASRIEEVRLDEPQR
jgi:hypothetical protein